MQEENSSGEISVCWCLSFPLRSRSWLWLQEGGAASHECLGPFLKRVLAILAKPQLAARALGIQIPEPTPAPPLPRPVATPQPRHPQQLLLEPPPPKQAAKVAAPAADENKPPAEALQKDALPEHRARSGGAQQPRVFKKPRTERSRNLAPRGPAQQAERSSDVIGDGPNHQDQEPKRRAAGEGLGGPAPKKRRSKVRLRVGVL
jgi:hypothetical protein